MLAVLVIPRRTLCAIASLSVMPEEVTRENIIRNNEIEFYCPRCQQAVIDPLVCGDCSAIICRVCGTPLERVDELGIG